MVKMSKTCWISDSSYIPQKFQSPPNFDEMLEIATRRNYNKFLEFSNILRIPKWRKKYVSELSVKNAMSQNAQISYLGHFLKKLNFQKFWKYPKIQNLLIL